MNGTESKGAIEDRLRAALKETRVLVVPRIKSVGLITGDYSSVNELALENVENILMRSDIHAHPHVIVTASSTDATSLIKYGVPIISVSKSYNPAVVDFLKTGIFDCVWDPEDLPNAIFNAQAAGKIVVESSQQQDQARVTLSQARLGLNYMVVASGPDRGLLRGPQPSTPEIIKGSRDQGYSVKLVTSFPDLTSLVDSLSPSRVLFNIDLVPADYDANKMEEFLSKVAHSNPAARVICVLDGFPPNYITDMAHHKRIGLIQRPTTPYSVALTIRDPTLSLEGIAHLIKDPWQAYFAARNLHTTSNEMAKTEHAGHPGTIGLAASQMALQIATFYHRFLESVHETPTLQGHGRPGIAVITPSDHRVGSVIEVARLDALAKDGTITIYRNDVRYDPAKRHEIWKPWKKKDPEAWESWYDSCKLSQLGAEKKFPSPQVLVPVELPESGPFVVQEAIIGPTGRKVLYRLSHEQHNVPDEQRLEFVNAVCDINLERLRWYQRNFTEFTNPPGSTDTPSLIKDPASVLRQYREAMIQAFEDWYKFTEARITTKNLDQIRDVVNNYEFGGAINSNTLVRNMAATLENCILRTHFVDMPLEELFGIFCKGGKVDREILASMMYRVDYSARKFSLPGEDAWQVLGELPLVNEQKVAKIRGFYETFDEDVAKTLTDIDPAVRFFRNLRETSLILGYLKKSHHKWADRIIDGAEFERRAEVAKFFIANRISDQRGAGGLPSELKPLEALYVNFAGPISLRYSSPRELT